MNVFYPFIDWLKQIVLRFYNVLFGLGTAFVGYFFPIKNMINMVIIFFIVDIVFGYLAARKKRGEKFSTKIIWTYTMPRIALSIVMIMMAFAWDRETGQSLIATYNLIGWFISGTLLYSVGKNGFAVTNWQVFNKIKNALSDKINGETGINIK